MNREEFPELLRYARDALRVRGFGDLDDRLLRARVAQASTDEERLLTYLTGVRDEIALGSNDTVRRMMNMFQSVETERGSPVEGIVVDIVESDVAAYGRERIDLVGSPELDQLVLELTQLIEDLRTELDAP